MTFKGIEGGVSTGEEFFPEEAKSNEAFTDTRAFEEILLARIPIPEDISPTEQSKMEEHIRCQALQIAHVPLMQAYKDAGFLNSEKVDNYEWLMHHYSSGEEEPEMEKILHDEAYFNMKDMAKDASEQTELIKIRKLYLDILDEGEGEDFLAAKERFDELNELYEKKIRHR